MVSRTISEAAARLTETRAARSDPKDGLDVEKVVAVFRDIVGAGDSDAQLDERLHVWGVHVCEAVHAYTGDGGTFESPGHDYRFERWPGGKKPEDLDAYLRALVPALLDAVKIRNYVAITPWVDQSGRLVVSFGTRVPMGYPLVDRDNAGARFQSYATVGT